MLLVVVWLSLLVVVCRDEFYLWHILPNTEYLQGFGRENDAVSHSVMKQYRQIVQYPFIEKMVVNHFGNDIAKCC